METLTFYVIRNKEGNYYRSKGNFKYDKSWLPELKHAKVFTKIGAANSMVTQWAEYGIADVIPLVAALGEPLNQDDRVNKALIKRELRGLNSGIWHLRDNLDKAKRVLERHGSFVAKKEFNIAKSRLDGQEDKIVKLKDKLKKIKNEKR